MEHDWVAIGVSLAAITLSVLSICLSLATERRPAEAFRTWPLPHDHVNPFSQVTERDKE
jgi:hypothetical protein